LEEKLKGKANTGPGIQELGKKLLDVFYTEAKDGQSKDESEHHTPRPKKGL